ncbi:MAG: hypothetical protein FJ384_04570 [Verrucomicrobia bacterium]|nr:hypothetical protein [Verrucomicrobiota bacterium]
MKQLFPLLLAAAVGSAATYFAMEARQPAQATAEQPKAAGPAFAARPKAPEGDVPDAPRKQAAPKFGGKTGGFLPEEIEGVTPEQLNKCRTAMFKSFQDEGVKAARARQNELRKEAEYASDDEKKNLRPQFEEAALDLRKATKEAMLAADDELTGDVVDKVLDALEERMKQRGQQFQKGKK